MQTTTFGRSRSAVTLDPNPFYRFSPKDMRDLEFLEVGWLDFPKDVLRRPPDRLGVLQRRHHKRDFEAHDRVVKLLAGSALASDRVMALKLFRCTVKKPCRSPLCWLCKHIYANQRRQEALAMASGCDAENLAWVTVVTSLVYGGVDQIAAAVDRDKGVFRDLYRRAANRVPGFDDLQWIGEFEIDHLPPSGMADFPPNKLETVMSMEDFRLDHEVPMQLVHVHKLVRLNGLNRRQLTYQLKKAFPGSRRVRVQPLHGNRSVDDNVQNVIGYATKNLPYFEDDEKCHKFSKPFPDNLLLYHGRLLHHLGGLGGKLAFNTRE